MQNLIINATPKSFDVICVSGHIEIKGCSIINDPKVFFKPIQNWIVNYLKEPSDVNVINIKIDYIDSASTKYLFEILKSLEKLVENKKSVQINWYYDMNDPEILEVGEILAGRIKVPFEFVEL
jgi:hypothetical protein